MVRLPIVAEDWLNDDEQSPDQTIAPSGSVGASDSQPQQPIGPVQGYPETGKDSWGASNDDVIVSAADHYNKEHNYFPGDAGYMTPQLMKAWMMRESGGSPNAFKTDPFQVNNAGDWSADKSKIAGLSPGQAMTPQASADAALKWLHYKGQIDNQGNWVPYQGHYEALRKYNGAKGFISGIPKAANYANTILDNAWTSYGDWQQ